MEFSKYDKVVNVKTGEFGIFQFSQEAVTASGASCTLYEIQLDEEGNRRRAWKAEEIAHWVKPTKGGAIAGGSSAH